ncbi:MAG: hypothetical protein J6C39_04855 [Clostridia bacterium]|nr:hypothetical protein [Clostridia bacterium]
MENKKYLGIDIGTTSLKAAVFNSKGERLGLVVKDYTLDTDSETGYIEFDAMRYVEMCREAICELTDSCGKIDALSVDTQGETLIFTDEGGKPLMPAIVWLDNRADKEADAIRAHFGGELVYNVTGQAEIAAGWPASKLLWLKNNSPELFSRVKKIFLLEDWILYNLTGNFVTEGTIQSSSLYYDITKGDWWDGMLEFIGVSREMLPKIVESVTAVGEYEGITVVSGMLDQIAGTIGAGVTSEDKISEMTGTIMAVCVMTDKIPPYNPESIVPCHLHAIKGKYCLILCSSTAGMALKWFKNQFAEGYSFKELDAMAKDIAPGSDGLVMLPYFCGSSTPVYNPSARAVFAGIDLSHGRGHFARAIMEAIDFNLRQNLEEVSGDKVKELRITGGGASSPLWATIKADVVKKELSTLAEGETACLGTVLCAAVGIGDFESIEAAADSIVRTAKTYAPTGADYEAAYARYCELDRKMNVK